MKFSTLKDFWEWLTISTGDIEMDFKALCAYYNSGDCTSLLTKDQCNIFYKFLDIYRILDSEYPLKLS